MKGHATRQLFLDGGVGAENKFGNDIVDSAIDFGRRQAMLFLMFDVYRGRLVDFGPRWLLAFTGTLMLFLALWFTMMSRWYCCESSRAECG